LSDAVFERVIRSQLSEIGTLAEALEEWADGRELPLKPIMETNLMLDELITNIVTHGYGNRDDQAISVRVDLTDNMLEIRLTDQAPPFDLLQIEAADTEAGIDDRDIGGLGIHFVRKLSDSVAYERVAGQNVVIIRKRLPAGPG
jgi:serine/threonine-protein kinase RsbW